MFGRSSGTKTILADMLLKRGLRSEIASLREGELGYVKDEKRVIIGTVDSIDDLAMANDLNALREKYEKDLEDFKAKYSEELNRKAEMPKNAKTLDRLTNSDMNAIKKIAKMINSGEVVIIQKAALEDLIKKAGENND